MLRALFTTIHLVISPGDSLSDDIRIARIEAHASREIGAGGGVPFPRQLGELRVSCKPANSPLVGSGAKPRPLLIFQHFGANCKC